MSSKLKVLIVVVEVLVLVGLAIWGLDYWMTKQGTGWVVNYQGKPIITIGAAKIQPFKESVAFPKPLVDSFTTVAGTGSATLLRQAKYSESIRILRAENGIVYGEDFKTQEPKQFQWLAGTAYSCWSQPQVQVGDKVIDVTTVPDSVQFMIKGNDFRGRTNTEGWFDLTQDFTPGDVAKVDLVSPQVRPDGSYDLLDLMLLTQRTDCYNTKATQ